MSEHLSNIGQEDNVENFFRNVVIIWMRRIIGGILIAAALIWYGGAALITRDAMVLNLRTLNEFPHLYGMVAMALGIAAVALGCFVHFHFCWKGVTRIRPLVEFGKTAALTVFIPATAYVLWHILA